MTSASWVNQEQLLTGILELQLENWKNNLSEQEKKAQGFVTIRHTLDQLLLMHEQEPSLVLVDQEIVKGYCLALVPEIATKITFFKLLVERLDPLSFKGQPLRSYPFIIVGQVCIAKSHRGQGWFDKMYETYRLGLKDRYDFALTEVADDNQRSLKAHYRVGFETVKKYQDEHGTWWHVVVWDWS